MIINHTRKFVFVHVPKTAGTSVSGMLRTLNAYRDLEIGTGPMGRVLQTTYGRRYGLVKHSTAERISYVMGDADWNSFFTFGFARNPFGRLLSIYHFLKNWDKLPPGDAADLAQYASFEEFLEGDLWIKGMGPSGIYRPQMAWLAHKDDPRTPIVDFIGRQESLADDMDKIAQRIGPDVRFETERKANVTPSYRKEVQWTDAAIARVVERYIDDFEVLGYPTRPDAHE